MNPFGRAGTDRRLLPEGRLAGPMPWVIGIMTFLTILAAAAGLALGAAAGGLGDDLAGRLTVQVVEANPDLRERQSRAIVAELSRLASVRTAERVDDAQMRRLLTPWLGSEGFEADLPVPALIDVELQDTAPATVAAVTEAVAAIAPAGRVDAHAQWLGPLEGLLSTLQWLSAALVVLMATATSAAVVLASRAAMNTHRATIETMHLMGATDIQIARLFQRRAALDALTGSVVGYLIGVAVVLMVSGRLSAVGAALLDRGGLGWAGWLTLAMLPPAAVLLAILTARMTVTRALARML